MCFPSFCSHLFHATHQLLYSLPEKKSSETPKYITPSVAYEFAHCDLSRSIIISSSFTSQILHSLEYSNHISSLHHLKPSINICIPPRKRMALTTALALLASAQVATAHFGIEYPTWRDNTLGSASTSNYSQWEYPCSLFPFPSLISPFQSLCSSQKKLLTHPPLPNRRRCPW